MYTKVSLIIIINLSYTISYYNYIYLFQFTHLFIILIGIINLIIIYLSSLLRTIKSVPVWL